ncbi:MAG TPA: hypothetical protein VIL89_08120 [Clostridia bacterium]
MPKCAVRVHKKILLIVILMLLTADMAGCKAARANGSKKVYDGDYSIMAQPVEMKLVLGYSEESPSKDNLVINELNKLANANIQIEWTPMVSYNDKFNVLMASNEHPDVLLVPDVKNAVFVDGINAGMFWELTGYLREYSELSQIKPLLLKNASVEGKLYIIPRERALKRKMVVYRSDWAKEAGLGAPDTIDGIYNMAKEFAHGDFDRNMQNDTIGFALGTVNNEIDCFDALVVAFGGFNRWGIKDGKVIPSFMTEEYLETMNWLRKMFEEGLISPDFAITKTTQIVPDFVDKEKTGLWLSYKLPNRSDPVIVAKQKEDPTITREDVFEFAFLKGPDGKERIAAETGIAGGFAFSKRAVKDEPRLRELLSVFNMIQSREGQILINNGVPNVHFELVENKYAKAIDPVVFNKEVSPVGQLGTSGGKAYIIADDEITVRLDNARRTFEESSMISDITAPLASTSYSSNSMNLLKIISEAQFNYIMGKIDENGWQKALEDWMDAGGASAIKEFTAAYNMENK